MAELVVRDVDDAIVRALRRRADIHGRSEEAEHRAMLACALQARPCSSLAELLSAMPPVGRDGDFERLPQPSDAFESAAEAPCT
ncbi:DNA-binding protein [Synechococcus sp. CCY 9618]|uniref:FitA-like ribbon-helix-helix domain-containing protein n=1 Tax=Synechococcus sp. CCY 9618 TaxID=2815602 RepID=UPI001C21C99F|nr:DNA-binding protein [Synechococcus sp. CCY 9618]